MNRSALLSLLFAVVAVCAAALPSEARAETYGSDSVRTQTTDTDVDVDVDTRPKSETEAREEAERRDRSAEAAGVDSDTIGGIERADVDEVTRRRRALDFATIGFGPADLNNLESDGIGYNFYAGRLWEVNPNAAVRAIGEAVTDFEDAVMLGAHLGASFYPFNADISPFIMGDMGLGFARGGGENGFGFDFGGGLGVLLFRTSNVQLAVEAKAQMLLRDVANDNYPTLYSARLGILF